MRSVGLAVFCGIAINAATSAAALTEAQTASIDALISNALHEQKVFVTCSATLPPRNGELIAGMWVEMFDETVELLLEIEYPLEHIARFREDAAPEDFMLPADTAWSEVVAFCQESPDWMRNLQQMRMIFLPTAIKEVVSGT